VGYSFKKIEKIAVFFYPVKQISLSDVNILSNVYIYLLNIMHAMRAKTVLFTVFLCFSMMGLLAQTGSIKGRVYNIKNNEPLPFTNLIISGTNIGSVSDLDGNFLFTGLKPGFVKLEASSVGFERIMTEEIMITNAKVSSIDIALKEVAVQISGVEVTASVFKRVEESPVSLKSLGIAQIEKSPGSNRDISKVIQSLPGVASSVSFRNDIIVRGGGPSENRFLLDGIEIPNLNHFATQGASGGPAGIINTDFLREVDFYSGAFPASRGNSLSSVIDMKLIDGNPDRMVYRATLGASEMALSANGPVGPRTHVLFSVRQSYLKFLFSVIGLPFLPTFYDYTLKVKTKFNVKNELTILSIGALDKSTLNTGIKNPTEDQQYILDYLPVNNQWNYAIGANYRHYRESSYSTFVISRNMLFNEAYKYLGNDENISANKILDYSSFETENKIRYEEVLRTNGYKISFGTGAEYAKYKNETFQKVFIPGGTDTITEINYSTDFAFVKWNLFGQVSKSILDDRLMLSLGIRSDANNYSDQMSNLLKQASPRFSASWSLSPKLSLNFNTGRYFQLPAYTTMGYKNPAGELVNKANGLRYIQADHLVAGFDYRRNENSKITLEGFYKFYNYYPFSINDSVSLASKGADFGVAGDEAVTPTSRGKAWGAELYFREKLTKNIEATISYTWVRSSFEDKHGDFIPSAWDNRHVLNVTALATLAKNWTIGARWRFVGGAPYTPYDYGKSSLIEAWDVRGRGYLDYDRYNEERLGVFHQLDMRVDKEYYFKKWTLNLYLDIQNLYNFKARQPDELLQLKDDNGQPVVNPSDPLRYTLKYLQNESGTVLPTIGIIIEF
jgi:outer membrane receptor for ferrienterochelin and colicin